MKTMKQFLERALNETKMGHTNQFKSKRDAQKKAKQLTQETGVKHKVVKSKAYRKGGEKEIEVWTVVADMSNHRMY